jgi:hypothetical protein
MSSRGKKKARHMYPRHQNTWAWRRYQTSKQERQEQKYPHQAFRDPDDAGLSRYLAPTARHIAKLAEEDEDESR